MTNSDEYRNKLNKRLSTLIAVLKVTITKIKKIMLSDTADNERLMTIYENLNKTLYICRRAKKSLNDVTPSLKNTPQAEDNELASINEHIKFQKLPPINKKDIDLVDFTDLCKKLQEEN